MATAKSLSNKRSLLILQPSSSNFCQSNRRQEVLIRIWKLLRLPLIIIVCSFTFIVVFYKSMVQIHFDEEGYYLYGANDSYPVIEHRAPTDSNSNHPDFLYEANQGYRVVEFYAHWCHHCRKFRNHYIEAARQVTELLAGTDQEVKFYAVSCVANSALCEDKNIQFYPCIHLYAAGAINKTAAQFKSKQFDSAATVKAFGLNVDYNKFKTSSFHKIQTNNLPQKPLYVRKSSLWPRKSKQQIFDDIYLSFQFNLRNSIFMSNNPLDDVRKNAFHDWLILLRKTIPINWHIQTIVDAILHDFDNAVISEINLLNIVDLHPHPSLSSQSQWSESCSKGQAGMGYTCGLWQLFHSITIGFVEYNMGGNNSTTTSDHSSSSISTIDAAETIKSFVSNFFHCDECVGHFIETYNACSFDRCTRFDPSNRTFAQWIQLPVWLLETHNSVNVRLLKEKANREGQKVTSQDEIDKLWPAKMDCPDCWADDSRALIQENAFKYLKFEYWPSDHEEINAKISQLNNLSKFRIISLSIVTLLAFGWYFKKLQRDRLGSHKKIRV